MHRYTYDYAAGQHQGTRCVGDIRVVSATRSRFPRRVRSPGFDDVSSRTIILLEWSWMGTRSGFLRHTDIVFNSFNFL